MLQLELVSLIPAAEALAAATAAAAAVAAAAVRRIRCDQ